MLIDKARDYYFNHDRNCAETLLLAANDVYNLGASEDTVKALGVFGGGIGVGSLCGAAAGACAAIGLKYSKGKAHQSPEMTDACKAFMAAFNETFKSELCKDIRPTYKSETMRCFAAVEQAARILENYM